ncbi:hypothetical protein GCM10027422_41910 [Hymenobacter arcticus]
MIKIQKSARPPARLATAGAAHRAILEQVYDADVAAGHPPGTTPFAVDSRIYGSSAVKNKLQADQHGKCCYCESTLLETGFGDVEHFRPKGGVRQTVKGPLEQPGYYWLAYDWANLYFSCARCNQAHKRNYFPLANPASRARSHHDTVAHEQPLLLDLATEDPQAHLTFVEEVARPLTERGTQCIVAYGLNRTELAQRRREHWEHMAHYQRLSRLDPTEYTATELKTILATLPFSVAELRILVANARKMLAAMSAVEARYTGMVRANLTKSK